MRAWGIRKEHREKGNHCDRGARRSARGHLRRIRCHQSLISRPARSRAAPSRSPISRPPLTRRSKEENGLRARSTPPRSTTRATPTPGPSPPWRATPTEDRLRRHLRWRAGARPRCGREQPQHPGVVLVPRPHGLGHRCPEAGPPRRLDRPVRRQRRATSDKAPEKMQGLGALRARCQHPGEPDLPAGRLIHTSAPPAPHEREGRRQRRRSAFRRRVTDVVGRSNCRDGSNGRWAGGRRDAERALADIPVPSYVLDTAGVVQWINPAAERLLGDVRGRHFTSVVGPEDRARARELFARKVLGTSAATETSGVFVSNDGTRVALEVSAVPLMGGERVVGVFGLLTGPLDEEASTPPAHLTPRQAEVRRVSSSRDARRSRSRRSSMSAETVRNHVRHLMRALGVNSRLEAVAAARHARH